MKTPVRVLHPITRMIVGGAQENTLLTAALLDTARFQVEILCGAQTGSEGSLIDEARQRGVALTILPDLLRQVSLLHDWRALSQITQLMRQKQVHIVHTHSSKAGILGRAAAHKAGVPVIIHTVHGWSFHEYMSPVARYLYIILERWAARFTHALIAVSQGDIQKGLRAGIGKPEQYHLIHSAIPLDEFDPFLVNRQAIRQSLGLSQEELVVGNVGRFSPQKNPLDWVRVAGVVGRAMPQARFLLVGDGPLRSQVEAQLAAEGLTERCTLTGLRRDIPHMLAAMDIFMLTSLWEGLPRVIPQAMAMGLPVLANRADGIEEAVQHGQTGYLFQPGQIEEMAAACIEMANLPQLRYAMGQAGQAAARQRFDLRSMIAQITALYEKLFSGG